MIACISMGPDGDIYVNEGSTPEGNLLAHLPALVLNSLVLFDESRFNFSYDEDAERCARMLFWLLLDNGYTIVDSHDFEVCLKRICTPGGMAPDVTDLIVQLTPPSIYDVAPLVKPYAMQFSVQWQHPMLPKERKNVIVDVSIHDNLLSVAYPRDIEHADNMEIYSELCEQDLAEWRKIGPEDSEIFATAKLIDSWQV